MKLTIFMRNKCEGHIYPTIMRFNSVTFSDFFCKFVYDRIAIRTAMPASSVNKA